jgi:hypothetical protein
MRQEGDNPAKRPPTSPQPANVPDIRVTPENVVALAAMFRDCANLLQPQIRPMARDMRLAEPWMGDPVSKWAMIQFNLYFVSGEHSFVRIVQSQFEQHVAMRDALVAAAKQYGLTDELAAAGFTK